MSKFNSNVAGNKKTQILNREGAVAFTLGNEMELYSAVTTTMLSDKFYDSADDTVKRIVKLVSKCNPYFVAKLAIYARNEMNLRSVPLLLITALARTHNGDDLISVVIPQVVKRADEITELLACYCMVNGRTGTKKLNKVSNQILKGLGSAFNNFNEYQFSKYNRKTEIRLRDALFLTHPKPKDDKQQVIFDKIAKSELKTADTWETQSSAVGQVEYGSEAEKIDAQRKMWEDKIDKKGTGRLNYMALLRNLRNMLTYDVSYKHLQKVCARLSDKKEVRNSKQFPFRYLSAYKEISYVSHKYSYLILEALEKAVLESIHAVKGFDENTPILIASDVSGSMESSVSERSKVMMYDIGLLLSLLLQNKSKNVITGMFGRTYKRFSMPRTSILNNVDQLFRNSTVGHSTNGYLVIDDLIEKNDIVEKVFIFTDCQLYSTRYDSHLETSWKKYRKIAPNAKLYIFDLTGYGNTPLSINRDDVHMIAGWSEKIFEMLYAIENGSSVVKEINSIEI